MNCWNLRLWRQSKRFGFAKDQKERVSAAHRGFRRVVKLRIGVTVFPQLLHALRRPCAQIIEPTEDYRFGRANLRACRRKATLLAIITEGALECAASVGQRLRPTIDHTKRARDDAISAAIAHIVLNKH